MSTSRRPSGRLLAAVAILVAGLVGSVAWGLLTYESLQGRLEALPRTDVPGEATVEVDGPQGLTIFYEDRASEQGFVVRSNRISTITSSPVELSVTGPSGPLELARYERDLRFDVDGRVATALATFDAPTAGTYTVHVAGEPSDGVMVSVGDVVTPGLLASFVGAVALFLVGLVAATVIFVTAFAKDTEPTGQSSDEDRRPLAGV